MKYYSIISIGYFRCDIGEKLSALMEKLRLEYHIYSRINELGKFNDPDHIRKSRDRFENVIVEAVKEINSSIAMYNSAAGDIFSSAKVERIRVTPVRKKIKLLFSAVVSADQPGYNLVAPYKEREFYDFLIKDVVDPVLEDLIKHKQENDKFIKSFKINEYDPTYKADLSQMLDIYLMGYKSTAILILGRIFEKQFTLLAAALIVAGKFRKTKEELNEMRFENLLGSLKSIQAISDKDWHILSKLRLDRNIGGHYISEKDAIVRAESENEAEATIKLALPLLKKYHLKYLKLTR